MLPQQANTIQIFPTPTPKIQNAIKSGTAIINAKSIIEGNTKMENVEIGCKIYELISLLRMSCI